MEAISPSATPPSAQANINTVVALEEEAQHKRTTADRISDGIANFVGSIPFVVLHLFWFGGWVVINTGWFSGKLRFDPYPFALLCMLVSLEGVLLSTFVLIKQNRMSKARRSARAFGPSGKSAFREGGHKDLATTETHLYAIRH